MLDPDPQITGRGQRRLREANIATDLFPTELMAEIEEMNRDFTRDQRRSGEGLAANAEFIQKHQGRSLDQWYRTINGIYWNKNFGRDPNMIFAHLVEVIGGISSLASSKVKGGIDPQLHLAKALAWWMSLCGKLGVKSAETLIWDKFPGVCAYCHENRHDPDVCSEKKATQPGPLWDRLAEIGGAKLPPGRLGDWQAMFSRIYPAQQTEDYGPSFARLAEELGELAEAVRVFPAVPGYFLSEAADVFAWLMHTQNIIDFKKGTPSRDRGRSLEISFCRLYPDSCKDCGRTVCACPPIIESTVGRIAHEVPPDRGGFGESGRFMTPDKASKFFQGREV